MIKRRGFLASIAALFMLPLAKSQAMTGVAHLSKTLEESLPDIPAPIEAGQVVVLMWNTDKQHWEIAEVLTCPPCSYEPCLVNWKSEPFQWDSGGSGSGA